MRKIYPVTVGLLALAAGGASLYFVQHPLHALTSRPRIAECLPGGALVLLSAPDPRKTATDWQTTDLYKIWSEPEVRAFLQKPLGLIPSNPDVKAALAQADKVDPKNLFIALTSLDEKDNQPHLIAGFQFKGNSKDVDTLLAKPKEWLRQTNPTGKADLLNYQGRAIETLATADGETVASVYLDDWYLISNDLPLLKSTIDQLEHRAPANTASLDQDADFQTVCGKLPSGHETLIFARLQPFFSRVYSLMAASGQPIPAESRAEAEKLKAFGATTLIEDGKLRDTVYMLAPGLPPTALARASLPLTSADTLLYIAGAMKMPAHFDLPAVPGPGAAAFAALGQWSDALGKAGISLDTVRKALGEETALQLDWPAQAAQPGLIVSFDIKDRAAAQQLVDAMIAVPLEGISWQKSATDAGTFYTLTIPTVMFVTPTVTLTDKHLIAGLSAPDVRAAAAREKTGGGGLAQTEGYKTAAAKVVAPNVAFAYLDARAFFDRVYGVVKPAALMGAALLAPQVNDYVDLGKLPAAETISKHLSPTVFSEAVDGQGMTLESVGSMTLGQAFMGVAMGGGGIVGYRAAAPGATDPTTSAQKEPAESGITPPPK